jgi:hypothetical protein
VPSGRGEGEVTPANQRLLHPCPLKNPLKTKNPVLTMKDEIAPAVPPSLPRMRGITHSRNEAHVRSLPRPDAIGTAQAATPGRVPWWCAAGFTPTADSH